MQAITIVLGGASYVVEPLNLGEIEDLGDVLLKARATDGRIFESGIAVIVQALKKKNPEVTGGMLRSSFIMPAEIRAAQNAILQLSGLAPAGEEKAPAPGAAT